MGIQIIEPVGHGTNSLSGSMIKLMNAFQRLLRGNVAVVAGVVFVVSVSQQAMRNQS